MTHTYTPTQKTHIHSVGLLWMKDQLVAEISTWQHTTLATDRHAHPWRDSNLNRSIRTAANLRQRPRVQWRRQHWPNQSSIKRCHTLLIGGTDPGAHPASCKVGTECLPQGKSDQAIALNTNSFYGRDYVWAVLYLYVFLCLLVMFHLTFRHRASCILGQAFRYSPENAFYIFNQQIYFIIWYLLDRASLI